MATVVPYESIDRVAPCNAVTRAVVLAVRDQRPLGFAGR